MNKRIYTQLINYSQGETSHFTPLPIGEGLWEGFLCVHLSFAFHSPLQSERGWG